MRLLAFWGFCTVLTTLSHAVSFNSPLSEAVHSIEREGPAADGPQGHGLLDDFPSLKDSLKEIVPQEAMEGLSPLSSSLHGIGNNNNNVVAVPPRAGAAQMEVGIDLDAAMKKTSTKDFHDIASPMVTFVTNAHKEGIATTNQQAIDTTSQDSQHVAQSPPLPPLKKNLNGATPPPKGLGKPLGKPLVKTEGQKDIEVTSAARDDHKDSVDVMDIDSKLNRMVSKSLKRAIESDEEDRTAETYSNLLDDLHQAGVHGQ